MRKKDEKEITRLFIDNDRTCIYRLSRRAKRRMLFSEVKENEPIPKGLADLAIKANIKTHIEGYYRVKGIPAWEAEVSFFS